MGWEGWRLWMVVRAWNSSSMTEALSNFHAPNRGLKHRSWRRSDAPMHCVGMSNAQNVKGSGDLETWARWIWGVLLDTGRTFIEALGKKYRLQAFWVGFGFCVETSTPLPQRHFGKCRAHFCGWFLAFALHHICTGFFVQEAAREPQAAWTATCEKSSSLTDVWQTSKVHALSGGGAGRSQAGISWGIITKGINVVLLSSSLTISIIINCDPGRRGSCKTERGSWECKQRKYCANSSWTYLLDDTWRTAGFCFDYSDAWDRKRKLLQERSRLGSAMHMSSC